VATLDTRGTGRNRRGPNLRSALAGVVLPFDNMSGDADLGYFSDSMWHNMIAV